MLQMQSVDLIIVFTTAFSMSIAHCTGMCGGIVVGYSSGKIHKKTSNFYQAFCHILYSLGRVSSYMLIGIISAFIGHGVSASMKTKGVMFIVVGVLMIVFTLLYAFFPKAISYMEPSIPRNPKNPIAKCFKIFFVWLMNSKNLGSFYGLGLLNGFFPCGMVYNFALIAATTASIWMGAITMGIFGLATFVPMIALGFFTGVILTSSRFRNVFMKISFVLMLCFGGYNIYKGVTKIEGKKMTHHMGGMNHKIENINVSSKEKEKMKIHNHSMSVDSSPHSEKQHNHLMEMER